MSNKSCAVPELENDQIVRDINLKAPIAKVWDAISDSKKFGTWFGCVVEGAFIVSQVNSCHHTFAGGEGVEFQILVKSMEPESYFAYSWSPRNDGRGADVFDSEVGQTLVEFSLEAVGDSTHLTIRESGFATLPESYRGGSFKRNSEGWSAQVESIKAYVES